MDRERVPGRETDETRQPNERGPTGTLRSAAPEEPGREQRRRNGIRQPVPRVNAPVLVPGERARAGRQNPNQYPGESLVRSTYNFIFHLLKADTLESLKRGCRQKEERGVLCVYPVRRKQ